MFLKKMNVHGFKSFADKTEIIIEKGMTAIVGPNGSGKSNISDSIKWVLGEQSPKTLRGSKMEDIIFAGTEKRMPLGYAEVELVFDNEDGKLPIEYKEVSIKRRLFRTGESEYYINKQQCRLKDVRELFLDTGIGKDGYSVIGQGKVEEILSPNSDVRRAVFEEAAGIVKFKFRKEESIKKIEKTNNNLDRVNDIIYEIETRVEPLRLQSEKAKKYIDLKDNLKNIELNLYVREYEKNKEQLTIFENQKNEIIKNKQEIIGLRDNLEKTIEKEKQNLSNIELEISTYDKSRNKFSREYEAKKSLISVQNEKILLYSENVGTIENEINVLKEREKEINIKIDEYKQNLCVLNNNIEEKNLQFNSLNEEALEFKIKMETSNNISEEKRNELFEMHKSINKLNSDKSSIESIKANYEERINQFEKEIEIENGEKSQKIKEFDVIKQNKKNNEQQLIQFNESFSNNSFLQENLIEDKKELENRLKASSNELNNTNSRLSFLNNMESLYEGYYKSVQTLMSLNKKNNLFRASILGTVADVIKTDKNFETAIEIALGSAIQNVIVNNNQDAESIINYLKDNKIGRVTFLPISTIKSRSLNNAQSKYLSMPGVVDTADKLIETDDAYSEIIKNLLGRTIIVENIRDGFRIAKASNNTIKIVSLQGDVINPGGSVTGGHISGKSQNFLSRKREIEECQDRLIHLKKKCADIDEDLRNVERDLSYRHNEINTLKVKIENCTKEGLQLDNKISLYTDQIEKTESTIKRYISDKEYIFSENEKREKEIEQIDENVEFIKDNIEKLESLITDIANANKSDKLMYDELIDNINQFNNDLMSTKQEIKITEEKINNANTELTKNKEMLDIKSSYLNDTGIEITTAKNQIQELIKLCENIKIELDKSEQSYSMNKEEHLKKQEFINTSQNNLNSINKKLTESLDDEYGLGIKIEKLTSKIEDISNHLWEDYEMNYAMALPYKNEEISYNKINTEVSAIRREIKKLGDINTNSIEEYKEVKERYDFLTAQKQDLVDAKLQLNDVINELEIKMKEQFVEEFRKIRVIFNEVFSDLFSGGKADVYLEDESDALNSNIEIAAQPPGKKLTKITLLSGGEKALTAIALLFSILKSKPTSFCILDEIEAALDDINVYRFSKYLKEFSKETQFLCITHRKGTMENADTLYGTTMEEKGVTKLVSMKLSGIE
ncbi:chromosome segregation protein SMC [Sedimentibacter sp. zth1]|uniref:chromosome segregation protein SMC n=1 Tax=Sedimentibacter sp. zth1 TaxID=2816908 RepID=UPI001A924B72|nr:chromosome segregation protein SMC [Sedimentibacter sp. zth1]QSX06593.1 chromosome segregation protein SMC [Sedimentibacter sp. zth1]